MLRYLTKLISSCARFIHAKLHYRFCRTRSMHGNDTAKLAKAHTWPDTSSVSFLWHCLWQYLSLLPLQMLWNCHHEEDFKGPLKNEWEIGKWVRSFMIIHDNLLTSSLIRLCRDFVVRCTISRPAYTPYQRRFFTRFWHRLGCSSRRLLKSRTTLASSPMPK